ncbi:lung adenoma susceptibility protein 2 isoform X5 [Pseudochaenichthys georgianus]|uniref:lung adenoma susceptibility protein 2 isoform X5 n=1 Tax=Pseudochaenichthys georgianus TaxID=52239 RepID=UPI00146EC6B4|nr:lung adenoma susceptibility protein 2 isoform X5 [Pseudochaenichthys georgianus]
MESGHLLSPESTVTSLLSSSSHLRSSLLAPEHNTTFRHRDKNYTSASAALDAYISDFERSQSSQFVTRGLVLPHSLPSTPRGPRASTLRNTDVLREHLTDRELDFLSLPVSSLHHRGNRDRLSITTDELLSIPYDGSMPVTHTSAFLQGLLSQCGAPQPRAVHRSWDRLSSSHPAPQMKSHHPHPTRSSRCRGRPGAAMMNPDVDMVSPHRQCAHRADPSVCLHLPRWFTSNKTDMDCSGISNVPDQKYPAWIQRCDVSERPPPSESDLWDEQDPRGGAPSWVAELDHEDQTFSQLVCVQVGSWQTLRDLRLQLAEHICLLAAENNRSGIVETMFRDNRLESLIQKADQVLSCLTNNPAVGGADGAVRSANTEQLLSSSHCCPPIRDSVTVGGVTEAGTDRGAQRSEGGADLETFPGGPSLQRAMHHLSRLKVLVEEPKEKPRGQKDEDEGRYSSSSADGLSCTQLKPS